MTESVSEIEPLAASRLARSLAIPTVSNPDYPATDFEPFKQFIAFLKQEFPRFHEACSLEIINDFGLVYKWECKKDVAPSVLPLLFLAHYDVVPVEEGSEGKWEEPPFAGKIRDGYIWGRGALDIKSQLLSHFEAVENLLAQGAEPSRDIYFAYGQDEETGGHQGAYKIVDHFQAKGLRFSGVLDEGGIAVTGAFKGVDSPLALVGLAEKGFCNFELTVSADKEGAGHSSMPPAHTAIGYAAQVVCKIEEHPLPARLIKPVEEMLRKIAPEMGGVMQFAINNLWLFKPLVLKFLAKNPETNALIRTTLAATVAKAGDAANVLPQTATITVNARILPGDTVGSVAKYLQSLSPRIAQIKQIVPAEPSNLSPASGQFWNALEAAISKHFPSAILTPYLTMVGTDARKYTAVSDFVYRFTPQLLTNGEKSAIHNNNERISVQNYNRMIEFYEGLFRTYSQ